MKPMAMENLWQVWRYFACKRLQYSWVAPRKLQRKYCVQPRVTFSGADTLTVTPRWPRGNEQSWGRERRHESLLDAFGKAVSMVQ